MNVPGDKVADKAAKLLEPDVSPGQSPKTISKSKNY